MNNVKNYQTKQKQIILELLKQFNGQHFVAQDLLKMLNDNQTPVGKATIYRYLDNLVLAGTVKKLVLDNNYFCYQYVGDLAPDNCCLLKCETCGHLTPVDNKIFNKVVKAYDFTVDNAKTILYGYCRECRAK